MPVNMLPCVTLTSQIWVIYIVMGSRFMGSLLVQDIIQMKPELSTLLRNIQLTLSDMGQFVCYMAGQFGRTASPVFPSSPRNITALPVNLCHT